MGRAGCGRANTRSKIAQGAKVEGGELWLDRGRESGEMTARDGAEGGAGVSSVGVV